jgi:PAS domain S-box-containing protein
MQNPRPAQGRLSALWRYGAAFLFVAAALVLTLLLQSVFSTRFWFLFIAAVVASAWFGGKGPGWLAAVLSTLATDYIFQPAPYRWTMDREAVSFLLSFAVCALLASWFSSWRHQIETALRQARGELEARVEERTVELRKANEALRAEVAERQRAEDDLRRSEAYLAEGQRLSHTGSWRWNVLSGEVFWSREVFRIFDLDPAETHPNLAMLKQVIHPEDRDSFNQRVDRAPREGEGYEIDFRIVLSNGSVKYVHSVGHPVLSESGAVCEFYGVLVDVTEQHQARVALEKAYAALRTEVAERQRAQEAFNQAQAHLAHVNRVMAMAELTAFIAHELNQPLAAVVTSANACERWLAGNAPDIEKARDALGRIVKAGMMASEVVARNRALFQRSTSERQRLDVNEVIRETTDLLRHEAMRHGVSMQTELAADLPAVTADRVQLQQVLVNLLMNGLDAIKATADQSGELHIRSRRMNSKEVLIMVQDSGVGLDAELVEKVFSPFFTTKSHGLGLGLTISRSIVESHGGRLWAVPSPSRGATFQFTLPAEVRNGE